MANSLRAVSVTKSDPDYQEMGCGTLSGEEEAKPAARTMGWTCEEQALAAGKRSSGALPNLLRYKFLSFFFSFSFPCYVGPLQR